MFYNKNPNDQMLGIVLLMMFCDFYHAINHHFSPPFGKYVLDFFQPPNRLANLSLPYEKKLCLDPPGSW